MPKRLTLTPDKLAPIISVWLRELPKSIWAEVDLKKSRDPLGDIDNQPRHQVARFIAAKFEELGWEITYGESRDIFSGDWPMTGYKGTNRD